MDYINLNDMTGYMHYHAPRYKVLHKLIHDYNFDKAKILDIGNSKFSEMLSELINCQVDELGFNKDSNRSFGKTIQFDLNEAQNRELWRKDIGLYDIIVFAEVLEHLYTSPCLVLKFLYSLLNKNGKLIIQTPNAAAIHKRLKLLWGINPYMLIRENNSDPGHYREYTKRELINYAIESGFEIEGFSFCNYFDYKYTNHQSDIINKAKHMGIINFMFSICPPDFKPGMTLILNKRNDS